MGAGDEAALEQLVPIVHAELRRIARRCMAGERKGHTLQATALVSEAYLLLIKMKNVHWQNQAHFLAMSAWCSYAAVSLSISHASKGYKKRGGGKCAEGRQMFDEDFGGSWPVNADGEYPRGPRRGPGYAGEGRTTRKSRVVEMRFFGGLSVEATAIVLKVSAATVMRDWNWRSVDAARIAGRKRARVRGPGVQFSETQEDEARITGRNRAGVPRGAGATNLRSRRVSGGGLRG